MILRKGLLLLLSLSALLVAVQALAETPSATLSGLVRDVSGTVEPEVKVTVKNIQTGAKYEAMTDSEGRYKLTKLEMGEYNIRAERANFRTAIRSGVILTSGRALELDVVMFKQEP